MTTDHLGSPRINTDQNGNVTARHDYHPFGEEIARASYGADDVRKKFTSYERDIESSLDFAEARYYNPAHGRFTAVDPLMASASTGNPQTWNRYAYVGNNPINLTDPTGMIPTDFIDDETGQRTRIEDGKDQVLAASSTTINAFQKAAKEDSNMYYAGLSLLEQNENANLHLTTSEFTARVQTTYGESSAFRMNAGEELSNEMKAIAYVNQRNGVAYGDKSPQGLDYKNTPIDKETDKMKLGNLAVVNQVRGGPDPSNGATHWDGRDQAVIPESEKRRSVPANEYGGKKGTWEVHKNTIGWQIGDEHYSKWKAAVGKSFRAPQNSKSFSGKYGFRSTAVWGQTIFWKEQ